MTLCSELRDIRVCAAHTLQCSHRFLNILRLGGLVPLELERSHVVEDGCRARVPPAVQVAMVKEEMERLKSILEDLSGETLDEAWNTALTSHRQIAAATAMRDAASYEVEQAKSARLPQLGISSAYTQFDTAPPINPAIIVTATNNT